MACRESGEYEYGLVMIVPKSRPLPKLKPDVFMGVDFRFDDGPIELTMGQVSEDPPTILLLDDGLAKRFADHERLRIRFNDSNRSEFVEDFDISKVTSETLLCMCTQTPNPCVERD